MADTDLDVLRKQIAKLEADLREARQVRDKDVGDLENRIAALESLVQKKTEGDGVQLWG